MSDIHRSVIEHVLQASKEKRLTKKVTTLYRVAENESKMKVKREPDFCDYSLDAFSYVNWPCVFPRL